MVNLSAGVIFNRARTPDKPAIIYKNKEIKYADFYDRIMLMAGYLQSIGIKKGDVVAVFMKNSPAFLEIVFAASSIGAVFLPINYRLSEKEASFLFEDAKTKIIFVDSEFEHVLALPYQIQEITEEHQEDSRRLVREKLKNPQYGEFCPVVQNDLARLMYTSGTTSLPKGVMHTYENIYWKTFDHIIFLGLTQRDILLTVGPLYHVGAFDLPGIAIFEVGGTMCLLRDFSPEEVLSTIEKYKVTCGWMAPVMVNHVLSCPNTERFDLSSFQWCIAGGEKTPESRIRRFTDVFHNGRFIDGYGMTETCSGDTLMEAGMELKKIGSTGRAMPHVEIRIKDEQGVDLPPNELGEICIRGPKVTKGYWNAPDKTKESFFGDWLRSGDVGYLDEDGFLYITDRSKDMILTGAENVASLEVENVIFQLP